ncbi:LPS assembly protein LptD [Aliiroseovarius sp. KMU-50]|uniref:LPS-assembly protein LptD n=1 Tax=Aliiroseovarius salicola TaxID=3009082 RepID=A0ABT4W1T9_9RHOB|nr:LPS assembly protein LptD [Aliiroseovarius sp. KMU-50]MDA5094483.1 LPS assembly protein LptD [Aliiroseovarius sp. KMU-50]
MGELLRQISRLALAGVLAAGLGSVPNTPAHAQSSEATSAATATLIADRVQVLGNSAILAEGNVLIHYKGITLTAAQLRYDKQADHLTISGPIILKQGEDQIIFANEAELSGDLRNGILRSARLVLDQQLQIAAVEINRIQGRYTQLNKIVASSCQVCANNPVPLWQIRAEKLVHDEMEKQLYFHNAQLRVAGVPIVYLPRLRIPDPTLKRATGFLAPKIRTRSTFGTGILAPYFISLGDHADLTFSPFLATKTRTLEWRYRQAFRAGNLRFTGAVSDDDIRPGTTRYYVFGEGEFDLPYEFKLAFQLQDVSDPGYLLDYGYSEEDRLRSAVALTRARRDELIFAGVTRYETLRASEIPISDNLPFAQIDALYERRWVPALVGGQASFQLSAQAYFRESGEDKIGRDVTRLGASLNWRRDWLLFAGLQASVETGLNANVYWVNQDSDYDTEQSFATPSAAVTLRWPWSRISASGAVDVIEPIAQISWSDQVGARVPNEDSQFVEFDENNLFDMSRYPGFDRQEEGARANLGMRWSRFTPTGWSMTFAAGRVFRFSGENSFSNSSGLDGDSSDWFIAAQLQMGGQFAFQGRALLDDAFDVAKTESRLAYFQDDWNISAAHLWVASDLSENRTDPLHEIRLDGAYQINDFWRISAEGDFDIAASQVTKGRLELEYRNECLLVGISLSRRFTASDNINPTTDASVQVELLGFGGAKGGRAHRCMQ